METKRHQQPEEEQTNELQEEQIGEVEEEEDDDDEFYMHNPNHRAVSDDEGDDDDEDESRNNNNSSSYSKKPSRRDANKTQKASYQDTNIKNKDKGDFEIEKDKTKAKRNACMAFDCAFSQVRNFEFKDPFNSHILSGLICRKDGPMGGSLYITKIDNKLVKPQLIYGVPKLKYPYTTEKGLSEESKHTYKDFSGNIKKFFLSNKWNGTNIQFYKYTDTNGAVHITAKTKGSATLTDGDYGGFLSYTEQALGFDPAQSNNYNFMKKPPKLLKPLVDDPNCQSISYEICGNKLPHLVKYDFGIALKPLFKTYYDGTIEPIIATEHDEDNKTGLPDQIGPLDYTHQDCVAMCEQMQERCFQLNEQFRRQHGLKHRYEYEHFAIEGYVLYLLSDQGRLPKRTMYKIKPKDIEEVHWSQFDDVRKGQVKEAVEKCLQRSKDLSEQSMREELDMGDKEWGRFGVQVMNYVKLIAPKSVQNVLRKKYAAAAKSKKHNSNNNNNNAANAEEDNNKNSEEVEVEDDDDDNNNKRRSRTKSNNNNKRK